MTKKFWCSFFTWFLMMTSCGPEKNIKSTLSKNSGGCDVQIEWLKGPSVDDKDSNKVRVSFEKDGETLTDYTLTKAGIYMKIHSHGGFDGDIAFFEDPDHPGAWIIQNFAFTMTGPWELNLSANRPGFSEESWELKVEV